MCCVTSLLTVLYRVTFSTTHSCSRWQALMTLWLCHLAELVNSSVCCLLQMLCCVVLQKDELNRLRDGEGRPPGVMGWWPSRATTFLENHDTVRSLLTGPAFFITSRDITDVAPAFSIARLHPPGGPAQEGHLLCSAYLPTCSGSVTLFADSLKAASLAADHVTLPAACQCLLSCNIKSVTLLSFTAFRRHAGTESSKRDLLHTGSSCSYMMHAWCELLCSNRLCFHYSVRSASQVLTKVSFILAKQYS